MNEQSFPLGLLVPYILGGILILTTCIAIFTRKRPSNAQTITLLIFGFLLIALPIASKITIDIKGIKVELETATAQVVDLKNQIVDLKQQNTLLANQLDSIKSNVRTINDPSSSQNEKRVAKENLGARVNNFENMVKDMNAGLDSAKVKSDATLNKLDKIKTRRWIFRK
jgi:hypothetical protein